MIISLTIGTTHAQLSLHGSFYLSSKVGLDREPYHNTLEIPLFYGLELGYRLDPRFDLRLIYYMGHSQNGLTSSSTHHSSNFSRFGLSPQFAFYISPKKIFRFDVGIPIFMFEQEVFWTDGRDETMVAGGSTGFTATGTDKAALLALGLSPKACFHFPKGRIQMEIGIDAALYELRSHSRVVHENTGTKNYDAISPSHRDFSLALHLSLGYSFW